MLIAVPISNELFRVSHKFLGIFCFVFKLDFLNLSQLNFRSHLSEESGFTKGYTVCESCAPRKCQDAQGTLGMEWGLKAKRTLDVGDQCEHKQRGRVQVT